MMADSKIEDLNEMTTPAGADVIAIVDDPAGSPETQKLTWTNILAAIASAVQTLTNKTFDANGTGNSLSNVDVADLADGTDGELITWSAAGAPTTVAVGTATHVLTSNGVGAAPTFQASAGGGAAATFERKIEGEAYTTTMMPIPIPDELAGLDIKEVRLTVSGLPTGQDINVDVRKNGTATTDSVFTSDVPQDLATTESATNGVYQSGCNTSGSTVGTAGTTLDAARVTLAADDILWVYVTQVGSTLSGTDLGIIISVA